MGVEAMGSEITLGLGRLRVDWGKNEFFRNHSRLFLSSDIGTAVYYYAEDHEEIMNTTGFDGGSNL
jgi:hypothetical protein